MEKYESWIHRFLPQCIALNRNALRHEIRTRTSRDCFGAWGLPRSIYEFFLNKKGDFVVLLSPFTSCNNAWLSFTFDVTFVSRFFVSLNRLQVASFTSFLQIILISELWASYSYHFAQLRLLGQILELLKMEWRNPR